MLKTKYIFRYMKRLSCVVGFAFALGAAGTLFADGDMQDVIPVVIVEPSSSSVASSNSSAPGSSSGVVPESGSSQDGSSQEGGNVAPGSNSGTTAIRRMDAPSAVPQGDKWFDTKGRRLEKKPGASGSYINNGKMQTVK